MSAGEAGLSIAEAGGSAGESAAPPAVRRRWRRLLLTALAVTAVACLLYLAYLRQALAFSTNSDGAGNVLQAWDMLHGNLLLRGWWLSDVSFYTTELPEYMIVEFFHGLHATVIPGAAAATYTLLVLLAAALGRGRASGRGGLLRALVAAGILLAPGPGGNYDLLSSPDHIGTMVPLLLIFLLIDLLGDRDRWYLPVLAGAALAWVQVADELARYVGAVPVIVVCGVRLWRRRPSWRTDAGLLAAAVLSVPAAWLALRFIRHIGGFVVSGNPAVFAPSADLPGALASTLESVLGYFGADFFGRPRGPLAAIAVLHLAGVLLAAWAFWVAARRLLRDDDRVTAMLVVGIVVNVAAYVLSTESAQAGSGREIAAVLPFGAVLAARVLPGRPRFRKVLPALAIVLVGYVGVFLYDTSMPPAGQAQTQTVASWLQARHLTSGIGDYWSANITTAATSGRVRVRAVTPTGCGQYAAYVWEAKQAWYQPPEAATFMVTKPDSTAGSPQVPAAAIAQFGRPVQTAMVDGYEVIVWDHNLLPAVSSGSCKARWPR